MTHVSNLLQKVTELIPPPTTPLGLDHTWDNVEKEIGTDLPHDYKEFIDVYGSGLLGGMIWIWNWRDANLGIKPSEQARHFADSYVRSFDALRSEAYELPYAVYPDSNGLLPFATVIDVDNLNWLMKGPPDKWDIVYWHFDGNEMVHLPGDSFLRFLVKLLNNEYGRPILEWDLPYEFTDFSNW